MAKNIYVGNLSYNTDESALTGLFEGEGFNVVRTNIITDRDTGRPRGFGFVEIETDDASEAITALNGRELDGRKLIINEARERSRGGGGGGGPRR